MNDQRAWGDESHVYEAELEAIAPESPSVAVLRAVAALTNCEPELLEPLGQTLDPDALDGLLDSADDSDGRCRVAFRYHGFLVEVVAGDSLRLTPLHDDVVDEASR
ncbi:HalOD1 output domain-containing protein [Halosimplex salinum]|uniref:HalOD1 output domain-containing protein n=1 Tax=Halosimplex salinum TaxID=1710538 RepID=UPI000F495C36|nr:HalOD1 output domain-containing protein [Halosimplex salinum]